MRKFIKMQNAGNDYIYTFEKVNKKKIKSMCDRNFGVGGDGIVRIYKRNEIYGYTIYNSDGSRAKFCGNATICVAYLLYKNKFISNDNFKLLTDAGIKKVGIRGDKTYVDVDKPTFKICKNLIDLPYKQVVNKLFYFYVFGKKTKIRGSIVNVGNLHFVIITNILNYNYLSELAKSINQSKIFKDGINVEFVSIKNGNIKVVVFERGSGFTLACGSGACAVFFVLNKLNLCKNNATINYPSGKLFVELVNKKLRLYGKPKIVFYGEF